MISANRSEAECAIPIRRACELLEVSKSGYCQWLKRGESATGKRRKKLADLVEAIFKDSGETYGYRRIKAQLHRQGEHVGDDLVRCIIREKHLFSRHYQARRKNLTRQDGRACRIPDLVKRDFTATRPGEKFVGDMTYVPTGQGWVYVATVIDCYSKRVAGYAIDGHFRTSLITRAVEHANRNTLIEPGAIFHSDRGSNYTSHEFGAYLASVNIRQSVGRTGVCYDNAMAESFFSMLKVEKLHGTRYRTRKQARSAVIQYIEFWYNRKRLHSSLGYITPNEKHAHNKPEPLAA